MAHDERPLDETVPYEPHVGTSRQYWRDIILGVNDGLVSTVLLVAVVVGGGLNSDQILLTAVGGAIAGAISMAAGEFLATKSQTEVLEREINLERDHIRDHREMEVNQLRDMLADLAIEGDDLDTAVSIFSSDDNRLLNSMKVMEFGMVDTEERSPYAAMGVSGLLFMAGALPSVIPFAFTDSPKFGLLIAGVLTAIGLFAVGAAKSIVTKTNPTVAGIENLAIAGVGGVIAFWIGILFDKVVG
ncbi:MAG: VIT1/CCC1 transporter family protein [Acidimicrobiia bacterium]|nr:VIT1/CCC1 transporter family protein [Acidimicrobiia bacterium]MDX2467299.1 VIT1/CCC1 transporter family protein [Acidimicrobiia bacterium]